MNLPAQVRRDLEEAERLHCAYLRELPLKRGRRPTKPAVHKMGVVLVCDSEDELDARLAVFFAAVGPRKRGNKRVGQAALYADLVDHFFILRRHRITLPRGKSLSLKACGFGFGDIMRKHGVLAADARDAIFRNSEVRKRIGNRFARVFNEIANAIKEIPPAIIL